jgi:UDPglucose 6-dehydrogenase
MARKIAVIGTGYVGLVTAVGLADFGNEVLGVDLDEEKVKKLNAGIPTIYEPGIEEYLQRNIASGRLSFSTDLGRAVRDFEVLFNAVGTPSNSDGSVDLSQIDSVVESIARAMDGYRVIVTKSTVPVGTNRRIKERVGQIAGLTELDVVANPEFLREGKALQDFFHPNRIVIGCESAKARETMADIYRPLYLIATPFVWCSLETAELIKYASNAFLATKITFINQMANLAEAAGADIHAIARAMGMDGRISAKFLHPGPGFGGSCFPKDTRALVRMGEQLGVEMSLVRETIRANEEQKLRVVEKLERLTGGTSGKTIAVLGLAFKAETDDVRESPAIAIVEELLRRGAAVRAHDPKAISNFRKLFPEGVRYCSNEFEAAAGADALVLCTEWNEYRNIDLGRLKERMKGRVVVDARNVLDMEKTLREGFVYEGIGRKQFSQG